MGLRSRIKGRLKKLLDDAQSRQSKPAGFDVRVTERPPAFRGTASNPPMGGADHQSPAAPAEAASRRVIRAPLLVPDVEAVESTGEGIRIWAEPQKDGLSCRFLINQPLVSGMSWYFSDSEQAKQSAVGSRVFELDGVESLAVDESTVMVSLSEVDDWNTLAPRVGQAIREAISSGEDLLDEQLVASIPDENTIRTKLQTCIDEEVNPGVAAHSGYISLTRIRGNSVYIQMGGGCQGCSAADLTLKQGIHQAFRKAVPQVGAIYDETDHAAGLNPYFS